MVGLKALPLLVLLQRSAVASPVEGYGGVAQDGAAATVDCTATSFGQVESVLKSCKKATLQDIKVPAGGQIKLEGLHGSTVS